MRKLLLFGIVATILAGCSDDGGIGSGSVDPEGNSPSQATLSVSTSSVNYTSKGGVQSINITSSNEWTASLLDWSDNWCTISPTNGKAGISTLTISTTTNNTYYDRTTSVIVKSGSLSKTIKVEQKQDDVLTISSSKFEVAAEGGEISVEVIHNVDFNIVISNKWITQSNTRAFSAETFTFKIAENKSSNNREGKISFISKDGAISQSIKIIQDGEMKVASNQIWFSLISNASEDDINSIVATAFGDKIVKYESKNGGHIITLKNGVSSIPANAFRNTPKLLSMIIGDGITSIGEKAFYNCKALTSISIPGRISRIENGTFQYCSSLKNVNIPNNVTLIGKEAFRGCSSLTNITIPESVTQIGDSAFRECSNLTNINIPNSVTKIEDGVFINCSSLANIIIPQNVTEIGGHAFRDCSSLTSITIPSQITTIESYTFDGCSSLKSVDIGKGVTHIGVYAFRDCNYDLTVYCRPINPPYLGYYPFMCNGGKCSGKLKIYVPVSSLDAYKNADSWDAAYLDKVKGYYF